jgi:hypothetical protein
MSRESCRPPVQISFLTLHNPSVPIIGSSKPSTVGLPQQAPTRPPPVELLPSKAVPDGILKIQAMLRQRHSGSGATCSRIAMTTSVALTSRGPVPTTRCTLPTRGSRHLSTRSSVSASWRSPKLTILQRSSVSYRSPSPAPPSRHFSVRPSSHPQRHRLDL